MCYVKCVVKMRNDCVRAHREGTMPTHINFSTKETSSLMAETFLPGAPYLRFIATNFLYCSTYEW